MSGPCMIDSETVTLTVEGLPGDLKAVAHDVSSTHSATQGDDALHVVTDTGVSHVQTQTTNVANPLTENPVTGIVVVGFSPIIVGIPSQDTEISWLAELLIDGVLQDSYAGTYQYPSAALMTQYCAAIPSLLGQIDIPAGGSVPVVFRKSVENIGPSTQWSFMMNGDKMVAHFGP